MSLRALRPVVAVYWRKRLLRILVAALVLTGAIFFQYRLTEFFPLPVEVEKSTPPYSPATATLRGREELVVDHPSWQPVGDPPADSRPVLLTHDEEDSVEVEAHFDTARLRDDLLELLRNDPDQKQMPPAGLNRIAYTSADEEETAPGKNPGQYEDDELCRTSISIALADGASLPTELHFFQLERGYPGNTRFEMIAVGADLVVELETRNFAANSAGKIQGSRCTKALSVGDWNHPPFSGALIPIVVPAGTHFDFSFTAFAGKTRSSAEIGYEPFKLEAAPLTARAVRKITQGATSSMPLIEAASVNVDEPLLLKHFLIRSDELRLDFSGKAMVRENGKYVATFDPWEFAKNKPTLLFVLTIFNAALVEWIRRIAFGAKKEEGESRKPTGEEKDQSPSPGDKESR